MGLGGLQENHPGVVQQLPGFTALRKQLNHAVVRLRQTAHNLMPDALLEEGLPSAIRYFCNGVAKTSGLHIRFEQHDTLPEMPIEAQTNLYRITQELIQNAIKHASATEILVSLNYREGILNLSVEDNGKGFSDAEVSDGLGLKSIRNRLKAMNGHMEISKLPESGTVVLVELRVG